MNPFKRGRIGLEGAPRAQKPEPVDAGDGVVTLRLYDAIDSFGGEWGTSAREFNSVLDALPRDTKQITLLINSPGGEVWDGLAILNALRAHPARVVAVVEGIAASAASFIAAGCDEVVMRENSEMFVHNAIGLAMGDADDMIATAEDLTRLDKNLASIYAAKSGKDSDYWLAEMKRDRFYTAEEAVEAGLADRVEGVGDAASARALFDLSMFTNRGAGSGRHAERVEAMLPDSSEPGNPNPKEAIVADLKAGLAERLGLTDADAEAMTEDELLAALDAALESEDADKEPVVASLPTGTVAIDAEVLAQLRGDAEAGRQALNAQIADRRDGVIAKALKEGRITPATQKHYRDLLEKDEEGVSALLGSLAPSNALNVGEGGHQVVQSDEDALMAAAGWLPSNTSKEG